ncbi:MAG: hypothetical protein ABIH72_01275 [archaeon]
MGFWDIFRQKRQLEKESVKISELDSWIKARKKETEEKEKVFLNKIKTKIIQLVKELEDEKNTLEKIDVNKIKEREKVQLIVKENLNNYIIYLEKLVESLKSLNYENPEALIERVNLVIYNFEKKSSISFQKATYLIGKELGEVKKSLSSFFKSLEEIRSENKELEKESKTVNLLDSKIGEMANLDKLKKDFDGKILNHEQEISNLNKKIENKNQEKEKVSKTGKYQEHLKKKEQLNQENIRLKREIFELKEMFDFKQMAGIFHSDEKKMRSLKKCREDFNEIVEKNNGKEIIELLNETSLDKTKVLEKLKIINTKKSDIEKISIGKDELEKIEEDIKLLKEDINEIEVKRYKDEKKREKLGESKKEALGVIAKKLSEIEVDMVQ